MSKDDSKYSVLPLIVGLVLGTVFFSIAASRQSDFNPEDHGLGIETTSHVGFVDGKPISGIRHRLDNVLATFHDIASTDQQTVLWIGASQLHAINKYSDGDQPAVVYANRASQKRSGKQFYFQASTPNASCSDWLALYQIFRQNEAIPDWLIVALVYDDAFLLSTQDDLVDKLLKIPPELLSTDDVALAALSEREREQNAGEKEASPIQRNSTDETGQALLEAKLVQSLESGFPGYQYRGRLLAKSKIVLQEIIERGMRVARAPMGVVRRLSPHAKKRCMDVLRSITRLAAIDGTKVLLYKQPFRLSRLSKNQDKNDYEQYYKSIKEWVGLQNNVSFIDLEDIVAEELWGINNLNEPDVFHFQDEGHRQLGKNMDLFFATEVNHAVQ